MGFSWYMSMMNNVFALFGLAGVLNSQRELIIAFFSYNTAQVVSKGTYQRRLMTNIWITPNVAAHICPPSMGASRCEGTVRIHKGAALWAPRCHLCCVVCVPCCPSSKCAACDTVPQRHR